MLFSFLKDILAPKKCYSCKKEGHFFCEECRDIVPFYEAICYACKGRSNDYSVHKKCAHEVFYDKVYIFSHYKNACISSLVKDLKYYRKKDISLDIGKYLAIIFEENEVFRERDNYRIIAPPTSFLRSIKNGYNHSELIAKYVAKTLKIAYIKSCIKKKNHVRQQSKLSKKERKENIKNAYFINKNKVDNIDKKIIIIVDDVISTGSTLNEIAKVLKKHGASKVYGLIFSSD